MDGQDSFDAFDFDDKTAFDDEVDAIGSRQTNPVIDDRKLHLMLELQAGLGHFVEEASVARALEESGAQRRMNLHGGTDHDVTRLIGVHESQGSFLCVLCVEYAVNKQGEGR